MAGALAPYREKVTQRPGGAGNGAPTFLKKYCNTNTAIMRTIILIDGENLRFSLNAMRLPGEQYGLREGNICLDKFFQKCLDEDDQFIRAYWYQTEKIHDTWITENKAIRVINKRGEKLKDKGMEVRRIMQRATEWKKDAIIKHERKLNYFNGLSVKFPEMEMVRKGVLKIDPFEEVYLGEKGLDIALAIGMVKYYKYCDKIILISGDLDYAEAIQYVKDKLRKVHIVRLFDGHPPQNRSVGKQLRVLADKVIDIYESEIRADMLIEE